MTTASCSAIGLMVLAASLSSGQTAGKSLAFDAASVKIADKSFVPGVTGEIKGGPGSTDPGRVTFTQVSLIALLGKAWDVQSESYRLAAPEWLRAKPRELDWYNITATMPAGTTRQQFQAMLQNLLIERFRIQLHHETRTFPGYELTVALGGSKLKLPADPDAPEPDHGPAGGADKEGFPLLPKGHGKGVVMGGTGVYAKFQNCTVAELIPYLRSFLKLATGAETNHVVDNTGLDGKYDYSLKFDTRGAEGKVGVGRGIAADSPDSASAPSGLPDLFRAVEKQLGLKLVKSKGFPLDTIVIDRIEKTPIEN